MGHYPTVARRSATAFVFEFGLRARGVKDGGLEGGGLKARPFDGKSEEAPGAAQTAREKKGRQEGRKKGNKEYRKV